jgi:hypothetical protein
MMAACKKNDHQQVTATSLTQTVSAQLSKADSLSSFNSFFKQMTFSDGDVAAGVTIFAIPNSAIGTWTVTAAGMLPDSSIMQDYVVKGIIKPADLVNNKSLTTLSGKTLTVTVSGDTVRVNGVIIRQIPFASGDGFMIYVAQRLYNTAAPLTFTVWDATKWAAGKPSGELSAQATVSLYNTKQDYASGAKAAYTATTDNNGVATFGAVKSGQYYVVAVKGGISSVLNQFNSLHNGVYLGYAALNTQLDANGNYTWRDVNADGIIDQNDIVELPYTTATASKDAPATISLTMGYAFKPIQDITVMMNKANAIYSSLRPTYENLVLIDGMMSDDAGCDVSNDYCVFDNFTFLPTTNILSQVWNNAYFDNIAALNYILRDIPGLSVSDDQKKVLTAQARGVRGYIYMQLLSYFGNVPIHTDLATTFFPYITQPTPDSVFNYIINDLTAAAADLPVTLPGGKQGLNKYGAMSLLARAYLYHRDYAKVLTYTSQIINSGAYSLAASNSWLVNTGISETIWEPGFSAIGNTTSWYYNSTAFPGITVSQCPVMRIGLVYLMDADAQIQMSNWAAVSQDLGPLRSRDGLSTATITNTSDAMAALVETWQKDAYRQGDRFINLQRWGMAPAILTPKGYRFSNSLLPIPQLFMNRYATLRQNPGY